ncbi:DUF2382 domain-containing protein [Pseudarthrobacter sp. HLT1-5]|nr:DUF2382 domain-containing protein [Pseudarthrobacter sp. HLT1-5]
MGYDPGRSGNTFKFVVTDDVVTAVPFQREEVGLEREPLTDGHIRAAIDGRRLAKENAKSSSTKKVRMVEKEAVPVERVRADKVARC